MSAVPVNDNDWPLGVVASHMVRNLHAVSPDDLKLIVAHSIGRLVEHIGMHETASAVSSILRSARATTAPMTLHEIAFFVAAKHSVTVADLRAPSGQENARTNNIVIPRQEAFWLARQQRRNGGSPRFSLPMIGRFFGGRDHSTVIYGIRRHTSRLLKDPV